MRQGPWKLVTGERGLKEAGLYNLHDDLAETGNLAEASPQLVKSMLKSIAAWQEDVNTGATEQPE